MRRNPQAGFSMIELPVALAVLVLAMSGLMTLMVQNARIHKAQQMAAEMQADTRICLELVQDRLRSAGWDPTSIGLTALVLDPDDEDPDDADGVDEIEITADLDGSGATDGFLEQVRIRIADGRLEWRPTAASAFVTLAVNVTNDADDDGVAEPLFVADDVIAPTRLTVRLTTRSAQPDPRTGDYLRYTLESEVALRGAL